MGLIEAGTYQFPEKPQHAEAIRIRDHLVRVEQENSRLECSDQLAMPLLRACRCWFVLPEAILLKKTKNANAENHQ